MADEIEKVAGTDTEEGQTTEIESGEIKADKVKNDSTTLDDILKNPKFQSDFDKKITKALEKAKAKWDEDLELTAEQKAEKQLTEREQALADREKAQEAKEFTIDLRDELRQKNLPVAFAELIAGSSTRDEYSPILKSIKETWDQQLAEAIKSSARQNIPSVGSTDTPQSAGTDLREFAAQNRKVK